MCLCGVVCVKRFDVFDSGSRPEYDQVVQTLVAHVFHLSVRCLAGSSLFDRYWRLLATLPTPAGALVAVLWAAVSTQFGVYSTVHCAFVVHAIDCHGKALRREAGGTLAGMVVI